MAIYIWRCLIGSSIEIEALQILEATTGTVFNFQRGIWFNPFVLFYKWTNNLD